MKIVLLLGPSSAGKSTTCAQLQKTHGWRISSGDVVNDAMREKDRNTLRNKLQSQGLITALQSLMTEKEVVDLCICGLLTISKGEHLISGHRFNHQSYPGLSERLTEAGFSEEEKQTLIPLLKSVGETFDEFEKQNKSVDPAEVLLDDAFCSTDPNESVVIDHIPEPHGRAEQFVAHFKERVEKYRQAHSDDAIQSSIVIACLAPQQLSARIIERNRLAEQSGDKKNKREGTFPFEQLGALVSVGIFNQSQNNRIGQISRDQLIGLVGRHQSPDREVRQDFSSTAAAKSITDSLLNSVFEYAHLSEKYGVGKEVNMQDLVIRPEFASYPRINTAVGSPEELAQQVIQLTQPDNVNRLNM